VVENVVVENVVVENVVVENVVVVLLVSFAHDSLKNLVAFEEQSEANVSRV
jgi:hypothetical protein